MQPDPMPSGRRRLRDKVGDRRPLSLRRLSALSANELGSTTTTFLFFLICCSAGEASQIGSASQRLSIGSSNPKMCLFSCGCVPEV